MKKKLLLTGAFVALLGTTAQAQTEVVTNRKWDATIETLLLQQKQMSSSQKSVAETKKQGVIIACTNAASIAENIRLAGYEATIISDNVITAKVPTNYIITLSDMEDVKYINGPRQFRPTMHTTRPAIGVDKIHAGEGLETPFTGKGVIVGVIDQGFEYKHVAFLDKNGDSRVIALWNHYANQKPTTKIPNSGDNISGAHGHATHVTGIAAGSPVESEKAFYGIAKDAEIVMVPSSFSEEEVLEEAKYIRDVANKEGKPFVINMSFGSQVGPHDGTKTYDQGMDAISQPGGILVAAMGNEGQLKIHNNHKFKKNEKVNLTLSRDNMQTNFHVLDIWGQAADGKKHLTVKPFFYSRNKIDYKTPNYWKQLGMVDGAIDPNNNKEHYYIAVSLQNMSNGEKFGVEIEGNEGDEYHAWINPGTGTFYKQMGLTNSLDGDNEYLAGEGAACIPSAIAVASYNGNSGKYKSAITGSTYQYGENRMGGISEFSSRGPGLGSEPKPLVAAPGHAISSAVSRFGRDFDKEDPTIVDVIKNGLSKDYYMIMSGTSMASPTVAGTIALWLQANPKLTYQQIKQIIMKTAVLDSYTGTRNEWDTKRGYGKLDAYAGLKEALVLAENTGVEDMVNNSQTPVSLMKQAEKIDILFNNDESYATISLYNASGVEIKREQLKDIHRGDETSISTTGLPKGVYLVRINTTASTTAKKMLVK